MPLSAFSRRMASIVAAALTACGPSEVTVEVPAGFAGVVVLVSSRSTSSGIEVRVPAGGACRVDHMPDRSALRVCERVTGGCRRLPFEPGAAGDRHVFASKVGTRIGARPDDRASYLAFAVGTAAEREPLAATLGDRVRAALDGPLAPCEP
jgi:hypothetical protein